MSPFFEKAVWQKPVKLVEGKVVSEQQHGFDMELVTGQPPALHFHSWTYLFWQAQEMWPDQYCQMHLEKAEALDINDGDMVCVETAHGSVTARVWVTAGIRKTAVYIPMGWGERQPYHPAPMANHLTA